MSHPRSMSLPPSAHLEDVVVAPNVTLVEGCDEIGYRKEFPFHNARSEEEPERQTTPPKRIG